MGNSAQALKVTLHLDKVESVPAENGSVQDNSKSVNDTHVDNAQSLPKANDLAQKNSKSPNDPHVGDHREANSTSDTGDYLDLTRLPLEGDQVCQNWLNAINGIWYEHIVNYRSGVMVDNYFYAKSNRESDIWDIDLIHTRTRELKNEFGIHYDICDQAGIFSLSMRFDYPPNDNEIIHKVEEFNRRKYPKLSRKEREWFQGPDSHRVNKIPFTLYPCNGQAAEIIRKTSRVKKGGQFL